MFKDVIIILLTTLGLLVGIEVIMQVTYFFDLKNNPEKNENLELAFQFNEDYLVELVPGVEKTYVRVLENGGDSILWKVNQEGFRGSPLNDNDAFRIMVYGDSNIQARFSVEESSYVYKLGHYLENTSGREVEVINAGVVGFGPDQALLKFEDEVDTYKPDLVILNVFAGNDFGDIIRNRLFELDENDELVRTSFKAEQDQEFQNEESFKFRLVEFTKSIRGKTNEFMSNRRAVKDPEGYEQGTFNYFAEENRVAYEVYKKGEPRLFSHFHDSYETDLAINLKSESAKEKILLMKEVIRKMNNLALKKEVQFIVQIQPSATDLTPTNYVLGNEFLRKNYPEYDQAYLTEILSGITNELEILTNNLYPEFLNNNPESLFFKGENNHWNDRGQDLAAKSMANFLVDSLKMF